MSVVFWFVFFFLERETAVLETFTIVSFGTHHRLLWYVLNFFFFNFKIKSFSENEYSFKDDSSVLWKFRREGE